MNIKNNFFYVILIFIILRFGTDNNSLIHVPKALEQLLPQGWGFFTINPYYSNLNHFKILNEEYNSINLNSSSVSMMFGLNRENRRKSLAFNHIYKLPVKWNNTFDDNYSTVIEFKDLDSFLEEGIYFTIKEETLNINQRNKIKPRKAFYFFKIVK